MHTQPQVTAPNRLSRNNYRTTARIVGVLYLAGMVVGREPIHPIHSWYAGQPFGHRREHHTAGHGRCALVEHCRW